MPEPTCRWHHSPVHLFQPSTAYFVTASTLHKEHLFRGNERLDILQATLIETMQAYDWDLLAWAVFSNHYHFIADSPSDANTLKALLQHLHSQTSRRSNDLDNSPGRQVWFQYRDTCLTFEKSFFARMNYVMNNPVKHRLVPVANQYAYCSAGWFEMHAKPGYRKKVGSFGYDRLQIEDDF